jgi:hypothetical protein
MVDNSNRPNIKPRYIFCNNCNCETNHTCQGEHYRDYPTYNDDGSIGLVERQGYRLWICAGCESGTLENYYIFDVTDADYQNERMHQITYYPERNKLHVKSKQFKQLPKPLTNIYREMLGSYNNNLAVLCTLSIRALLEGICADKKIKGNNLREKINKMDSILPKNIVANLHSIRFIGNEAAHELSSPSMNELRLAIELCEDLLNFIYELDYKARSLSIARKMRKKISRKKVTEPL